MRPSPPPEEETDLDAEKIEPNRRDYRRAQKQGVKKGIGGGIADTLSRGPSGRVRSRTGKASWFVEMKAEQSRKKHLRNVRVKDLKSAIGEIAERLDKAGFTTVWDLVSVTDVNRFLVHGFRSFELRKIQEYLARNRVVTNWNA